MASSVTHLVTLTNDNEDVTFEFTRGQLVNRYYENYIGSTVEVRVDGGYKRFEINDADIDDLISALTAVRGR